MISPSYVQKMARYNRWQNSSLYEAADTLSEDARRADRGAFFKSIHATFNHILWADAMWMSRLAGEPEPPGRLPEFDTLLRPLGGVEARARVLRRTDRRLGQPPRGGGSCRRPYLAPLHHRRRRRRYEATLARRHPHVQPPDSSSGPGTRHAHCGGRQASGHRSDHDAKLTSAAWMYEMAVLISIDMRMAFDLPRNLRRRNADLDATASLFSPPGEAAICDHPCATRKQAMRQLVEQYED